jgi:hypothetical protein
MAIRLSSAVVPLSSKVTCQERLTPTKDVNHTHLRLLVDPSMGAGEGFLLVVC